MREKTRQTLHLGVKEDVDSRLARSLRLLGRKRSNSSVTLTKTTKTTFLDELQDINKVG